MGSPPTKMKVVFDSGKAVSWLLSTFCQDEVTQHDVSRQLSCWLSRGFIALCHWQGAETYDKYPGSSTMKLDSTVGEIKVG